MNNPRIVSIGYRVRHDAQVDYKKACARIYDADHFQVEIGDGIARFHFKPGVHHSTQSAARDSVADFIEKWEVASAIKLMPGTFLLEYDKTLAELEDLSPDSSNRVLIAELGEYKITGNDVLLKRSLCEYPAPPTNFSMSYFLKMAYDAWRVNHSNPYFLTSFGYLLLTILEGPSPPKGTKNVPPKRKVAATEYEIDIEILMKIGKLTSEHGGQYGRKIDALGTPLSSTDQNWLEDIIRVLMRRIGEHEYDKTSLKPIKSDNIASFLQ